MIESYRFGHIVIDGREYSRDLIILPNRILEDWWRREGHKLSLDDLKDILTEDIDVLIIGTGYYGLMKVPSKILETIRSRGIEVIIENTKEACQTYNRLRKSRKVAAALHLTC